MAPPPSYRRPVERIRPLIGCGTLCDDPMPSPPPLPPGARFQTPGRAEAVDKNWRDARATARKPFAEVKGYGGMGVPRPLQRASDIEAGRLSHFPPPIAFISGPFTAVSQIKVCLKIKRKPRFPLQGLFAGFFCGGSLNDGCLDSMSSSPEFTFLSWAKKKLQFYHAVRLRVTRAKIQKLRKMQSMRQQ